MNPATVPLPDMYDAVESALISHGAAPDVAAAVATATRESEECGNTICGLAYVESYCRQLATGRVDGVVAPVVSHARPAAVRVDAKFGFAQPAFNAGIEQAVASAKELGLAALSIEHSHTCTSLGYFTERLTRRGVIALGYTNATPPVSLHPVATRRSSARTQLRCQCQTETGEWHCSSTLQRARLR